jgi:hypothetical protein
MKYKKIKGGYELTANATVMLPHVWKNLKGSHGEIVNNENCSYLKLYKGFKWNGSDVVFDVEKCLIASCAHDWLCYQINKGRIPKSYRKRADKLYVKVLKNNGMCPIRADIRGVGLLIYRKLWF